MSTKTSKPLVAAPVIDKLALVFKTEGNTEALIEGCQDVIDRLDREKVLEKTYFKGRRYRQAHWLRIGENEHCLIQFHPYQTKDGPLRIEFNPNKVGGAGVQLVRSFLENVFLIDYEQMMKRAKATVLHVAVDVSEIKPEQLIVHDLNKRKTRCFFGPNGEIESIYLGASKSDEQICIYDKTLERWEVGKIKLNDQITRIEARCCKSLPVSRLLSAPNPFSFLTIGAFRPVADDESLAYRFFLDSCRQRTANAALRLISDKKRRNKYRRKLVRDVHATWWQPEAIWQALPKAIRDLDLFPDDALLGQGGNLNPAAIVDTDADTSAGNEALNGPEPIANDDYDDEDDR